MRPESRTLLALPLLALLAGCLPYTLYHRSGVSVDDVRRDEVDCGRIALAQAPVEMELDIIPGRVIMQPVICDAAGNCRGGRARELPDRHIRRDVNEELRRLIARQCMAERGYQRLTLPACSEQISKAVEPAITRVLPKLTPQACVIRRGGENYQIVPG
ncbi:hypothetical protein [Pseudooceanicola sp.]|uniref:hypothetical protein n=1 Tax=Pseudooceanicola sp. TaxID=1914328 RepID=UPI002632EDC4|nr:hypothetical protein [Pseudooceanicola sp.]MDF1855815.1 hypothetical protein [Pseudooceanicola sp.]